MKKIIIKIIRFYQKYLSKYFGNCRFYPTCSQYAILAINKYGVVTRCSSKAFVMEEVIHNIESMNISEMHETRNSPSKDSKKVSKSMKIAYIVFLILLPILIYGMLTKM